MQNKSTTAILSFFLGGIGIHRFYLNQIGRGIFSILFCWTLIPLIIGLVDFFIFVTMKDEAFNKKYNLNGNLNSSLEGNNNSRICALCLVNLKFLNTPTFSSGKLNDGYEVCNKCFRKINNANPSMAFKLRKYVLSDVKELLNKNKQDTKRTTVFENRPLPRFTSQTITVPQNENIENFDLPENIDSIKLNTLAFIAYIDASGQRSERRITLKSIHQTYEDDYIITAFCHEREAQRSFKLSRIEKLVDMETGEIFPEPSKYFIDRFNNSPLGLLTKCYQDLESEILILTYIARADGYLRKKEREIISDFIQLKSNVALDTILLDNEIRRTYCESSDLRKSLKLISKQSDSDRNQLYNCAKQIIETDKKTDPMEMGVLELIKTELKL